MKPKAKAAAPKAGSAKRAPRRRRWLGRGVLWVIATLFAVSGTLRLVETGGIAAARQALGQAGAASTPAQSDTACVTDAGLMQLHEELQRRASALDQREGVLLDREQAIKLAEKRIDTRLTELVAAEDSLSKTVAIADKAAEKDVGRLVTLYEQMKPKMAAPLFEEMAPEFAAGFLARMRPDAAAALMASLQPKTAYTISVLMAGRNAGAPKN